MKELISNDLSLSIIAQAIDEMKAEQGKDFSMETLNLAELELCTYPKVSDYHLYTLQFSKISQLH